MWAGGVTSLFQVLTLSSLLLSASYSVQTLPTTTSEPAAYMLRMASYPDPNLAANGVNVNKQLPFPCHGSSPLCVQQVPPCTNLQGHQDDCDIFHPAPVLELDLVQPDLSLVSIPDRLTSVTVF